MAAFDYALVGLHEPPFALKVTVRGVAAPSFLETVAVVIDPLVVEGVQIANTVVSALKT
jgi:hypothetical protein